MMFLLAHHSRETGSNALYFGFAAFPLSMASAATCFYFARQWQQRAKALLDDMRKGVVLAFAGVAFAGTALARMRGREGETEIEVLPSGMLYSLEYVPYRDWLPLTIVEAAATPDTATVEREDAVDDVISWRALSNAELEELRQFLGRLKLEYLIAIPVLLAIYLGLAGNYYWRERSWWPSPIFVAAAALAMLGTIAYLLYWIGPRVRIGRDVRDATVMIIRQQVVDDDGDVLGVHVTEYLEHSMMPWTDDGEPAAWRIDPRLRGR